jgi:hypothetical protein
MFKLDWNQERPTLKEAQAIWSSSVFIPIEDQSELIREFITAVDAVFVNGGAAFASFSVADDHQLDWFISRNRYDEIHFFEHLLTSDAFRKALPQLLSPEVMQPIKWEWSNPYVLGGDLAHVLMAGGAYEKFLGSGHDAKLLGERTCRSLFGERYEDIHLVKTHEPWSSWFSDIAWDYTWIGVDTLYRKVWVICATDTD